MARRSPEHGSTAKAAPDDFVLSDDELAFLRLTCDLFPLPESPLRSALSAEPADAAGVFAALKGRGLLNPSGTGAAQPVLDRVTPVSECSARVMLTVHGAKPTRRDFYLAQGVAVEYGRYDGGHSFGPARSESALVAELCGHFKPSGKGDALRLRLSAGDYLVFAVFARDVRGESRKPDAHMSVDEVLAYFDEPEAKGALAPRDDAWQASLTALSAAGVLVVAGGGYTLHSSFHDLARQIAADRQHTLTRFDFLDDHWLVREVSLYPAGSGVYRMGTDPQGAVVIEGLSAAGLADVLAGVVGTLPNLLNPEAPPTLRNPLA